MKAGGSKSARPQEAVNIASDVRMMIYKFLKPSDLILRISKLSRWERQNLKESRESSSGYALNSSINKKKTMFNTFDSSMQTL